MFSVAPYCRNLHLLPLHGIAIWSLLFRELIFSSYDYLVTVWYLVFGIIHCDSLSSLEKASCTSLMNLTR
jgi:hypothetical protein